jgi:hypothetical protein
MPPDRTKGILAALDYLGFDFGSLPVVGRTNEAIPKRKADRWKSIVAAIRLRFS